MRLGEIWRYPVKSMGGERLEEVELGERGIAGDRRVVVCRDDGAILDARRHPRLLSHHATLGPDGLQVDGRPWQSPDVARDVEAAVGAGARLVELDGFERFDVLPLLVATDGALAAFGRDRRRLRPNLVIEGVPGLAERDWEGRGLRIGEARIGIRTLRSRCVMTTWDPDTQASDPEVLKDIVSRFGGKLALDAWVVHGGRIRVGDPVELIDLPERPPCKEMFGRYANP